MGITAAIFGGIGGLAAILGIVDVAGIGMPLNLAVDWNFWFSLAVILLLSSIAFAVGSRGGVD
ncbi:MAG: hypothetical protein ABID87_01940 [Chloroflexota bacterium]